MNLSASFRRLKWHEVVRSGDFVADAVAGLKPWQGLSGFRADSYVSTVYRRRNLRIIGEMKTCAHP